MSEHTDALLAGRTWQQLLARQSFIELDALGRCAALLDDAHVAVTIRALTPLRRRLRDLANDGVASGAFRGDVPPDLLAFLIEETARATLRELRLTTTDAAATVVRVVLSIAGLSWTEQRDLLAAHPDLIRAD